MALSSLMNIQFCLVRPLAGTAGVVTPAAGPVTIITITRGNRRAAAAAAAVVVRSLVSLVWWLEIFPHCVALSPGITRNTIKQVGSIGAIVTAGEMAGVRSSNVPIFSKWYLLFHFAVSDSLVSSRSFIPLLFNHAT